MTLDLRPEIAARLEALATAQGLSVEDYLKKLIERELYLEGQEIGLSEGDGMVWEGGLFVYRTGKPLPSYIIDEAVRRSRQDRLERILGDPS